MRPAAWPGAPCFPLDLCPKGPSTLLPMGLIQKVSPAVLGVGQEIYYWQGERPGLPALSVGQGVAGSSDCPHILTSCLCPQHW